MANRTVIEAFNQELFLQDVKVYLNKYGETRKSLARIIEVDHSTVYRAFDKAPMTGFFIFRTAQALDLDLNRYKKEY